jgi:nucleoside-diphosphate-sugar epimerase
MTRKPHPLPDTIRDLDHLEDLLSEPTEGVVAALSRCEGDLIVLGVGGKMGPSLARMARRALDASASRSRVLGVSRFTNAELPDWLRTHGIEPIACDLLDPDQARSLPEAAYVVAMSGQKFGTSSGQAALTWATNCLMPALIGGRYRHSKIVAFSTGNVYPLVPSSSRGSVETDPLGPVGEYAMSAVGRERIYEYMSLTHKTPMALIRLNYASEPRYGVLVDLARKVWTGEKIDLSMGYLNTIWQGDANAIALRAFDLVGTPPFVLNVTGPEVLSVRELAEAFGRHWGKAVQFQGREAPDALLNNAAQAIERFGAPRVPTDRLVSWIADWIAEGGPLLDKPTHFEVRDGRF